MKNRFFFLTCLSLCHFLPSTFLKAQSYHFYVGSGTSFFSSEEYTTQTEGYGLMSVGGSDNLFIRQPRIYQQTSKNVYKPKVNFEAGVRSKWQLKDRFFVETGIGVFTMNFDAKSTFVRSMLTDAGPADTVVISPDPIVQFDPCDYYTNSSSNLFSQFRRDLRYQSLGLAIPIAFTYQLLPDKLEISCGGSLRTPLTVNRKRDSFFLETELDQDGMVACTYHLYEEKDKTGGDFKDLSVALDVEITVWLGKLGFSSSASRWMTNLFTANNGLNSNTLNGEKGLPTFYSLRMKYRLDGKKD
ncbi:MAG: hypothetical protein R2825_08270 [Saprospiraceae bacterium]